MLEVPRTPCAKLYPNTALEAYLEEIRSFVVGGGAARSPGRLNQLDTGLLCAAQPVPGRLLARYFFVRAVTAWQRGEEALVRQQLRNAFAIFPDLQWDGEVLEPGVDPRALILEFKQAREVILQQTAPARFSIRGEGIKQTLYIDGEEYHLADTSQHEIPPGRHLVQLHVNTPSYRVFWRELEPGKAEIIDLATER